MIDIGLPEQAVGVFPLGFTLGLVVEDGPTEPSCIYNLYTNVKVTGQSSIELFVTKNKVVYVSPTMDVLKKLTRAK